MSDFSSVAQQQSNLNQSQAFAAALQRAKQIAAKIQPNQAQPQQQQPQQPSVGFKRSHDDSDSGPENKRFTSPSDSMNSSGGGGGGGQPNMTQAMQQAAAVAARLAATAGTTCEEQLRIPESIRPSLFGRGSNDTVTHIQSEAGCKVQFSGDSDQILTLRGSRETVTKGREMIQQMASRNGGGTVEITLTINMPPPGPTGYPPYQELMIPGGKVGLVIGKGGDTIKQLQEKTGAKMVIIQDGPNQELIKPLRISGDPQKIETAKQMVLDLIAQKELQAQNAARNNTNMGGGNGGGFNNFGGGGGGGVGGESCEVFVPKIAVGVVIGKGGDMIRKIQAECGCKLQFIQGKNDEPGDRRCLIQGTRQQVDDAKRMIDGLIENVMQRNRNTNGAGGADNGNSNYGYGYGVNHAQQPPREEICFMVPTSKCGIVIGRGGETIKLINQQSGAYCEMDRNAVNPANEKLFKCKGTSEQVEAARQMISEKINMELPIVARKPISSNIPPHQQQQNQQGYNADQNYGQQWAGYGQQQNVWDQQQQAQMGQTAAAGGGQADYSSQWIEYYKSMGMTREAEMIEAQMKAKQQGGGQPMPQQAVQQQPQQQPQQQQPQQQAAAGPGAAGAGGADYSAQWAEYYRSIGKIDEAEAIEKQMKNGQPNNPAAAASNTSNGASAPAAGAAAGGYQNMTASQYAQYSQYYAAAAAQAGQPGGAAPGGYPSQQQGGYGGYGAPGGYPGAPQPPGGMPEGGPYQQKHKPDKN